MEALLRPGRIFCRNPPADDGFIPAVTGALPGRGPPRHVLPDSGGKIVLAGVDTAWDRKSFETKDPTALSVQPVSEFDILPMGAADLVGAQALSHAVGWPHRLEDWDFIFSLGHGVSAYKTGRLAGTAMWWNYDAAQARLGMVVVDPALQRAGLGRALMYALLERIQARSIMLNATAAGEPLYRKLGFERTGTIVQHQGASFSTPIVPLGAGERIRPLGRNDAEQLIALDAAAIGARRGSVIKALIANGDAVVLDRNGETTGFAFYRRFGRGHVIGPVVAREAEGAKALIAHWIGANAGMFIRVDVNEQLGLSTWLDERGLARVSQVTTMVLGATLPAPDGVHSFAVANQALG